MSSVNDFNPLMFGMEEKGSRRKRLYVCRELYVKWFSWLSAFSYFPIPHHSPLARVKSEKEAERCIRFEMELGAYLCNYGLKSFSSENSVTVSHYF